MSYIWGGQREVAMWGTQCQPLQPTGAWGNILDLVFGTALSSRTIMWAIRVISPFPVTVITKHKQEKLILITCYLTQYISNILISTMNQHKIFITLSPGTLVCILCSQPISIQLHFKCSVATCGDQTGYSNYESCLCKKTAGEFPSWLSG